MRYVDRFYPESRFGGFTAIDGTIAFYGRVNSLVRSGSVILDIGCGRGRASEDPVAFRRGLQSFKGRCGKVIGIDVSPIGRENPNIDEFRLIESASSAWPLDDVSVDLCLADSVLEHIQEPTRFFSECRRVTKAGGYVCLRTPNVRSYVGLATRLIPNRFHARILSKVQPGREENDVFPTFLACNTPSKVRKAFMLHGFDSCVYGYDAEPSYLAFSSLTFRLGMIIRAITPAALRTTIFGFARKR